MKSFITRRRFIEKELLKPKTISDVFIDPIAWIKNNISLTYSDGRTRSLEEYIYDLSEWYAKEVGKPELLYSVSYWGYTKKLLFSQFSNTVKMLDYDKSKFHVWLSTEPTKLIEEDLMDPYGVHIEFIDGIYKELRNKK